MHRGYIKLWRKSLDGGMLQNHKLWVFWTWCLLKASHKSHTQMVGYQEIRLEPGQFIFGRKKAAEETGLSERSIRTCLKNLKKSENLTIKTASKYSIVTIVNWEFYQSEGIKGASKTASKGPARGQQGATNKNVKNDNNEKKKEKRQYRPFVCLTDKEYEILITRYGLDQAKIMLDILNEYKKVNRLTYKCDYRVLISWIATNVKRGIYTIPVVSKKAV